MRTRSLARSLFTATVAVLGLTAVFAVSAGAQVNGARLAIGPTIPTSTTVGAKGVPVYISLTNLSEPTDGKLIIPLYLAARRARALGGGRLPPGTQPSPPATPGGGPTDPTTRAPCGGPTPPPVAPAAPGLSTQASPPITLGGQISDTANLTGGV